ncbi:hypothetical protein [Sphingomonas melonis]|uniref:Uncharacterized protein n=1 Tax=Sphingomonas melonis TaxID=152682 RepID=A0A7Y9FMA7_9SPHN|nr:hypothetical protein [Sphingomonas melonis]NYD88741.1 hypothetical protein [Sphingomonas melonis]
MADQPFDLFYLPFRPALDANGIVVPGASLTFYRTGTSTLQTIYADAALTIPLDNPVTANAAGVWPSIYIDNNFLYRVVLRDGRGGSLNEIDPYVPGNVGGAAGIPGAAANTYESRADLAASPVTNKSAILAAPNDTGLYTWQEGDFSGRNDVIASVFFPVTQGAWVFSEKTPDPVTGFFGTAFRGDNDLQYLDYWYIKPGGQTALRLNTDAVDNPGEVRDPAGIIMGDDGYGYYFRTIGFNSSSFEIRRTTQKNLVSGWQHWATVDCSAGGTIQLAWAPSPFRDPTTGKWYAEVALGPSSNPATHYMAVIEFTAPDFSTWKQAVSMGMGINFIDGSTIYSRGSFYHVAKHEETQPSGQYKYVEIWKSASYPTGWTKITNGDFLAIPYDVEGPNPIESADGVCHIFLDANASGLMYHTFAPSFEGPWSTPTSVDKGGLPLRHGFFVNITDANRAVIQQALDFYGVDLTGSGEAKFLLQGKSQKGQLSTLLAQGNLIGSTAHYVEAPGNYNIYSARGGPTPFVSGIDRQMAGAGATYDVAIAPDGTRRNVTKMVWATGYFDAPTEFEPRDLFALTLQNGWTALNNLPLKAYRDRMGRVAITGLINKTTTPTEGEVIAALPGGFGPARVEMFACVSNDGKGTTPIANLAVVNGTLIWISGGATKIYASPIQYLGVNSVTNV